MKVVIYGGRDYGEPCCGPSGQWITSPQEADEEVRRLYEVLDFQEAANNFSLVITGGARGADAFANQWATDRGLVRCVEKANWSYYGKKAGYIRNIHMANLGPELGIAFPGGKGTAMMTRILKDRGIPVISIE